MRRKQSLPERLNNPGAIKDSPRNKWMGLVGQERGFCRFSDPTYGVRAMGILFQNYQDFHGVTTLHDLIYRWTATDRERYLEHVSWQTGIDPNATVTSAHYHTLVDAMHQFESGYHWLTEAQITKGLVMAGIQPARMARSRTIGGSVGIGLGAALSETSTEIGDRLYQFAPWLDSGLVSKFAMALFLVGLGAVVWARIDDKRKGLR